MPTANTIPVSSLLSENSEMEETLGGTNQPYYLTVRKVRLNENKWLAQGQKEAELEPRWLDSKSRALFPLQHSMCCLG